MFNHDQDHKLTRALQWQLAVMRLFITAHRYRYARLTARIG